MITLTANELAVLKVLRVSSAGNGDDFGYIEDARKVLPNPASLGGVIGSLSKKGLFDLYESVTYSSGTWTQFVFRDIDLVEDLVK